MTDLRTVATFGGFLLPAGLYGAHAGTVSAGAGVAIALVGLLMLTARVTFDPTLGLPDPARRAVAPALALVMVSSAVILGASGSAAAVDGLGWTENVSNPLETCDATDVLLGGLYNLFNPDDTCGYYDRPEETNVSTTYAQQIYIAETYGAERFTNSHRNLDNASITQMRVNGKTAMYRALNNNSTVANTTEAINESVNRTARKRMKMAIQDWEARATHIHHVANETSGNTSFTVGTQTWSTNIGNAELRTVNVTLPGGVNYTTKTWYDPDLGYYYNVFNRPIYYDGSLQQGTSQSKVVGNLINGSTVKFGYADQYKHLIGGSAGDAEQVRDNLYQVATAVHANYTAGEINNSDLIENDPTTFAQTTATDYNSTGYYSYAALQLASYGLAGDINASHTVEVRNGSTGDVLANYTGTLFYTETDQDTFATGKTYQFDNLSGEVYMVRQDRNNSSQAIVLGNITENDSEATEFEIVEATNTRTGEAVNNTSLQRYVYRTSNTSEFYQLLNQTRDLRDYRDELGGGSGVFGAIGGTGALAIVVAVAAVILLRD